MKLVIIESPYAGDVERNLIYARRALMDSLARGEAPLASHLLYPQVLNDNNAFERRTGIEAGLAWAEVAVEIIFYEDYGMSPGMLQALAFHQSRAEVLRPRITRRRIGLNPLDPAA